MRSSWLLDVSLALGGFAFTVTLAVKENWQPADLVWGMWVTSLVTGYWVVLLVAFDSQTGRRSFLHRWAGHGDNASSLAMLGAALVYFLFFSSHFLLVHYVQELMVQHLLPLPDMDDAHPDLATAALHALAGYWPVVLASLVTRHRDFSHLVRDVPAAVVEYPYRAVLRNHLVIFMVAALVFWGAGTWIIYVLLGFYFFPFGILGRVTESEARS